MQVRRMLRATGVVVVAGLSYGSAAYADSVIIGTVISAESKKPVSDVVVTATSPNLQGEQVVVTDAQGQYRIPQLPPGMYTLRFDKESFKPFSRPEIQLRLDRTIRVNVEILPESFTEVIEVVGKPPTIDVGSTTAGVNVDQDFIKRIAVNRPGGKGGATRSFESLAELAPGAQSDTYGVSINGTTSPENGYVVDGLSTNDPAFGVNASPMSVEFVQDVNVITGGYMPEYGRSTGGVLNAVTKSGSNEFHGSVFANVTPGVLEGQRKLVIDDGSVITGLNKLSVMGDVGATLGGPIIKDKLWFFAGVTPSLSQHKHTRAINAFQLDESGEYVRDAAGNRQTVPVPGSERVYDVEGRSLQYMGKLTYLVNQDHRLSVSLAGTPSTSGGDGKLGANTRTGGLPGALSGRPDSFGLTEQEATTTSVALNYAGSFLDKKVLVDANVGWFHQVATTLPVDGSQPGDTEGLAGMSRVWYRTPRSITFYEGANIPALAEYCEAADAAIGDLKRCPVTSYTGGGVGQISRGLLDRYQANAKATYILDLVGKHVLKAGADVELLSYAQTKAYGGGVFLREDTRGRFWQDYRNYGYQTGPDEAVLKSVQQSLSTSTTVGGFLQDSWTVANRVTLNVGLRYDTQWLYGGDRSLAFVLGNQISPRLGVVVDPMADGRLKVFGNFARYYEQVPLNMVDRGFPAESNYYAYRSPAEGACQATQDPNAAGSIESREGQNACRSDESLLSMRSRTGLDPSFRHLGGKSDRNPVDPAIQPQSSDELLLGAEYELLANVRVGANYTHRYMNAVIEDMSRDDGNTYFLGNPGMGFAQEFPEATRNYDAVTVFLMRTFSDGWLAQASYTWSQLQGNYPGLFRPENGQLDPNITSEFDLISLLDNRTGLLPFDRTHAFKLFGAKEFAFSKNLNASLGLSYRGNSGTPINFIGAHPVYGQSEAFVLPRGSGGRTPWVNNIDSNINVNYRLSRDNVVSFSLDVFNIFNFQGVTSVDQTFTRESVLPVTEKIKPEDLKPEMVTVLDENAPGGKRPMTEDDLHKNFRNPTAYQAPRQIRFGIKYTF